MANIFIHLFLVGLLLLSCLMTVIILMQRPSANAGMGAALGGGAAESVFGGETANVLLKNTIWIAVAFFVICFLLFLWIVALVDHTPQGIKTLSPSLEPTAAASAAIPGNATSAVAQPGVNAAANTTVGASNITTPGITDLPATAPAGETTPAPATP